MRSLLWLGFFLLCLSEVLLLVNLYKGIELVWLGERDPYGHLSLAISSAILFLTALFLLSTKSRYLIEEEALKRAGTPNDTAAMLTRRQNAQILSFVWIGLAAMAALSGTINQVGRLSWVHTLIALGLVMVGALTIAKWARLICAAHKTI